MDACRNRCSLIMLAALGAGLAVQVQAQSALSSEGNQFRDSPYTPALDSYYGFRQAVGDYDSDGIDDMAVVELGQNSDRMRVYLGVPWDIGTIPFPAFSASTVATPRFLNTIVSGDFNGDGRDEVALGNRNGQSGISAGGHVTIMQRAANGTWSVLQTIRQGLGAYVGVDESGDDYGFDLAVGDFDNDGFDDLAIGAPGEATDLPPGPSSAGAVHVVYGSSTGLNGTADRIFSPSSIGLTSADGTAFQMGDSLAVGDFNGDGEDDLAIGAPNTLCENAPGGGVGAVGVLFGSPSTGLISSTAQLLQPGRDGMTGDCTTADNFGGSLASGRLNLLAPYDGLVISASLTDVNGVNGAGAIHIVRGDNSGLVPNTAQMLSLADLPGSVPTEFAQFGSQVAVGGLRTGRISIAIGVPQDTVDGVLRAGSLRVVHTSNINPSPFDPASAERWTASTRLGVGAPSEGDGFGSSMAIGDFNDDGRNDLVIGVPNIDIGADENAGAIQVLYQSGYIFRDGFE